VVLRGRITKLVASCCIARLVVLAAEDHKQPIVIYIDSAGGSAAEAMGIISTMNGIRCPVLTFCRGQAVGPAAIIVAHGLRAYRTAVAGAGFSLKLAAFSDQGEPNFEPLASLITQMLAKDTRREQTEVLEWFRNGAEFNSQDAMRKGFIDTIASGPVFPQTA